MRKGFVSCCCLVRGGMREGRARGSIPAAGGAKRVAWAGNDRRGTVQEAARLRAAAGRAGGGLAGALGAGLWGGVAAAFWAGCWGGRSRGCWGGFFCRVSGCFLL